MGGELLSLFDISQNVYTQVVVPTVTALGKLSILVVIHFFLLLSHPEVIILFIVVVASIVPCPSLTVTHQLLQTLLRFGVSLIVLGLVELEPKHNRDGVGFLLDSSGEAEEVLVHGEGLLHVLVGEVLEPSEHLPHHCLVQVVTLDQVQEQHVDEVLE